MNVKFLRVLEEKETRLQALPNNTCFPASQKQTRLDYEYKCANIQLRAVRRKTTSVDVCQSSVKRYNPTMWLRSDCTMFVMYGTRMPKICFPASISQEKETNLSINLV
jgi:hypothetical protein